MAQALGKGLQSLIPQKKPVGKTGSFGLNKWKKIQKESVFNVEVDKIRPNPSQPRKDLSEGSLKDLAGSIREHGVLQPLIVTKLEKATERGRDMEYELVAGERRWRAARLAGLPHVPVIIRDSSAHEKLEIALVENVQRENLNPVESALAFKQLKDDFGLTQEQVAKKVGKDRPTITNALRLLNLPQQVQEAIAAGKISAGHGRAVLSVSPEHRMVLFRAIINGNLSRQQAEEKARSFSRASNSTGRGPKNKFFKEMEKRLKNVIGRRVSITKRGEVGHINIEFVDQKEMEKIADHLLKL